MRHTALAEHHSARELPDSAASPVHAPEMIESMVMTTGTLRISRISCTIQQDVCEMAPGSGATTMCKQPLGRRLFAVAA